MSETQTPQDARDLGELFVSVTGGETVTERQEEGASKRPVEEELDLEGIEDGLEDAVDADLDSE